ncbi:mandelate racemase/muconate lactonizing enzyme family protein [Chloroflexota bacterium]
MKISSVEAIPFSIPLKKATKWAKGSQASADHILVRIGTDEGITGIAEAPPRPTIYGESIQSIKYSIDNWFGPMVAGMDPFAIEAVWDKFDTINWNPTAKAALDMALYDIIGKALNVPCYKLFGSWTDKIRLSFCINLNPIEEMVEEAKQMIGNYGFKALKLKIGVEPKKDIEMVKTMRQELGDDILLYADANQGYDPYTAIKVIRAVAEYGIAFVEEPCPVWDKKARNMVKENIDIPLMGDESCFTPTDVHREIELGTLRIVLIKTARTGFTLSRKIVHLCEQAGIMNLHGMQGDSSVGTLCSAHLCAGQKNTSIHYPSDLSFFLHLTDDFLAKPIDIREGQLFLSSDPGLGIVVDEDKLNKFVIK